MTTLKILFHYNNEDNKSDKKYPKNVSNETNNYTAIVIKTIIIALSGIFVILVMIHFYLYIYSKRYVQNDELS